MKSTTHSSALTLSAVAVLLINSCGGLFAPADNQAVTPPDQNTPSPLTLAPDEVFFGAPTKPVVTMPGSGDDWILNGQPRSALAKSRYVLEGYRWTKTTVTWRLLDGTADMSNAKAREVLHRAFDTWSAIVPNLSFQEITTGSADVDLFFPDLFCPSNEYALGLCKSWYLPNQLIKDTIEFPERTRYRNTGTIKYNDWASDDYMFLYAVALHEIGHGIGIDHSNLTAAIMAPSYSSTVQFLNPDDVNAARAIYGAADSWPIMRLKDNRYNSHYYSTSFGACERGNQAGTLVLEEIIGIAYQNSAAGRKQIWQNIRKNGTATAGYQLLDTILASATYIGYVNASAATGCRKLLEKQRGTAIDFIYTAATGNETHDGQTYMATGKDIGYVLDR